MKNTSSEPKPAPGQPEDKAKEFVRLVLEQFKICTEEGHIQAARGIGATLSCCRIVWGDMSHQETQAALRVDPSGCVNRTLAWAVAFSDSPYDILAVDPKMMQNMPAEVVH